ncbi:MAG: hypothetical protein V7760_12195 [Marinobacter sp.]
MQIPQDYSLVMMRMAFVHKNAPNAQTFMNFLLGACAIRLANGFTPFPLKRLYWRLMTP